MNTLFSVMILIVIGIIARFTIHIPFYLASFPNSIIVLLHSSNLGKANVRRRFALGFIITFVLQSYYYLAYTALVVKWTQLAISEKGVHFMIWAIAFLVVILPLWSFTYLKYRESEQLKHLVKECEPEVLKLAIDDIGYKSAMTGLSHQLTAMTFSLTLVGFFIFAFIPRVMEVLYNWVPYIGQ